MSPILVLSIDGASVRGIAQLALLEAIESNVNAKIMLHIQKESGRVDQSKLMNITDIFDVFAGTSAGALNVGAILIPDNPEKANLPGIKVKPLYSTAELRSKLPEILTAAFSSSTFRKIRTLGGLLGSKFTAKDLEKFLQDMADGTDKANSIPASTTKPKTTNYDPKNKRPTRMSDLVKPALITSWDLRNRSTMIFSTSEACRLKKNEDEIVFMMPDQNGNMIKTINAYLWQAMRSSSAAPVYYKPFEMKIGGKDRALIDAGLFVMSPVLLGWLEAQKIYPDRRIVVISISSGDLLDRVRKVSTKGATAGSIPTVLEPAIVTSLEGQQALADEMMQNIKGIEAYHRLTFDVESKEFDDFSEKNIERLKEAARKAANSPEFAVAINTIVKARLERMKDPEPTLFTCAMKEVELKKEEIARQSGVR